MTIVTSSPAAELEERRQFVREILESIKRIKIDFSQVEPPPLFRPMDLTEESVTDAHLRFLSGEVERLHRVANERQRKMNDGAALICGGLTVGSIGFGIGAGLPLLPFAVVSGVGATGALMLWLWLTIIHRLNP
jgi:hypothetical protein